MNYKTSGILVALYFLAALPAYSQVVTLVAEAESGQTTYSTSVVLAAGDYAEVLYVDSRANGIGTNVEVSGNVVTCLQYTISNKTYNYKFVASDGLALGVMPKGVIAGPATLKVVSNAPYDAVATLKIVRANAVNTAVPSNAVVIPENANGQFQLILESSTDLITWTAANPGTYGGSTTKRFFRTRLVEIAQ